MTCSCYNSKKAKNIIFLIFFCLGLPVASIISGEVLARVVIHFKYGIPGKTYGLWKPDSELGAIHANNAYNLNAETNDYGFRNKDNVFIPKPEGSLRIITYGGSTTFCYNLSTVDSWPRQLEKLLQEQHNSKDQVLNAGAVMWSIGHEFIRAKRDLPSLKPDYVIIYSGVNEEPNARQILNEGFPFEKLVNSGQYGFIAKNLDQSRWLKQNSVLVRYMDYAMNNLNHNNEYTEKEKSIEPNPAVLDNFEHTLENFIEYIKSQGSTPIYVVMGGLKSNDVNKRILSYSRLGAYIAEKKGVKVIDSNNIIDNYNGDVKNLFSETGVHWSKEGSKLLANYIMNQSFANIGK